MNFSNSRTNITLQINRSSKFTEIATVLLSLPPMTKSGREGRKPFTEEEAKYLADIKTLSGQHLFDTSDTDNFYQLVSTVLIMRDGEDSLTSESDQSGNENKPSQTKMPFNDIASFLDSKRWIFPEETVHESPLIDNIRNIIERMVLILEQDPVVEEGNIVCVRPGCSSRRIFRREQQTRGSDEATTVFLLCTECGKHWKNN